MASFQLALALVILSFWCATASPTPDGTLPPFSTQAMWPLMQKNSKALVDQNNVDRQAGAVPTGCYTLRTGQTVTIQSPNYPSSYPPNNNGMWSFTAADSTSRISMTCSDFRLYSYTYSYMIITGQGLRRGAQPSSVIVVIGEHNWGTTTETNVTQRRSVSQITINTGYNTTTKDNDIALIKLTSPIAFPADNKIAPLCLPDAGNLYENVAATLTGWGLTSSGGNQPANLYEVDLQTITNEECKMYFTPPITANTLCAGLVNGGKGGCRGDSGRALVTYGNTAQTYMIQIGVDVFSSEACNYPTGTARVTAFLPWIATNTAGSTYLPRP
ncbi:venom serine protease-like [Macrobrachium nipponense]|uniref:venom serine protease-like n=1 Tax=Macrobrachium nipponense TaxID=159736 RepID=UPI0030C89F97